MASLDKQTVLDALDTIADPVTGKGLTAAGLVRGLVLSPGRVGFMLEVPQEEVTRFGPVRDAAETLLAGLPGIEKAQVVLTAETEAPTQPRPETKAKLSPQAADQGKPKAPVATARPDHVRHVVVVGSGKGGVGKSTVSLNLALGLKRLGLRVGWLDADIYGPSAPVMLGITTPPTFDDNKHMVPPVAFGLKVNSVGFLVDADQAMIWRGPMASQALTQLLTQTAWGSADVPLDVLIVDLPPGTGDVQLTLTQKTLIDGAVVVSTPQDMALIDARRAVTLFGKTGTKVLGVVENMAYFLGADGTAIEIFGRGGARRMAEGLDLPFLGEVPLDPGLRQASDDAAPLQTGVMAERFDEMAKALWAQLT
ncbi:Mrp/NBP35 family ATP-binding protein [Asticcacaulis sp. BYS171W]|uniref:Iron-sulfur cluster carrier protein n=1 Tax=Asticcacaulis aquaticus TaxID=2984212 RepID=A0ABT5HQZ5_9CAUL|nr:Mrp/NBP35 family ATP-binding protein [Asticcacaulis aquaticus]MDC7682404.1 Mrp/NBP35 family ATP-binding protein [Asticcacaulis aquaticus]